MATDSRGYTQITQKSREHFGAVSPDCPEISVKIGENPWRSYFLASFAGSGLSGRSESQKIETTHQRLPSLSN